MNIINLNNIKINKMIHLIFESFLNCLNFFLMECINYC